MDLCAEDQIAGRVGMAKWFERHVIGNLHEIGSGDKLGTVVGFVKLSGKKTDIA